MAYKYLAIRAYEPPHIAFVNLEFESDKKLSVEEIEKISVKMEKTFTTPVAFHEDGKLIWEYTEDINFGTSKKEYFSCN